MGYGIAAVQKTLELYNSGLLKNSNNVIEMGAQELHLKKEDLQQLFYKAGLKSDFIEERLNWPSKPGCSSKCLYESLGIKEYQCIDISGKGDAIVHDLNKPFEDQSKFNKFDIVTDHGSCEHVFNIPECYKTMHNLTKLGGYIIITQGFLSKNGFYNFDELFLEEVAAVNNYKIVYNSYVVDAGEKTKNGSNYDFHIPMNQESLNKVDVTKLKTVFICRILQKTKDNVFKIPYLLSPSLKMTNIPGFDQMYFKEHRMNISSITSNIEKAPTKLLIKIFIRRFINKIRSIIK